MGNEARRRPIVVSTRQELADGTLSRAVQNRGGILWSLSVTTAALRGNEVRSLEVRLATAPLPAWIAVTSPRTASILGASETVQTTVARPDRPRLAVVGPATARELRQAGLPVDLRSPDSTAAGLAHALVRRLELHATVGAGSTETSVVWPRSTRSDRALSRTLIHNGRRVDEYPIYDVRTCRPTGFDRFVALLEGSRIGAVCLYAPSAVDGLMEALTSSRIWMMRRTRLVSFGRSTTRAIEAVGLRAAAQVTSGDVEDVADVIHQMTARSRKAAP